MAEDKLPCCRSESIAATSSDKVMLRALAISLSPFQNASSRLTLVLWPAMTMERLTTGDFIARLPFRSGGHRGRGGLLRRVRLPVRARLWCVRTAVEWPVLVFSGAAPRPFCAACERQ